MRSCWHRHRHHLPEVRCPQASPLRLGRAVCLLALACRHSPPASRRCDRRNLGEDSGLRVSGSGTRSVDVGSGSRIREGIMRLNLGATQGGHSSGHKSQPGIAGERLADLRKDRPELLETPRLLLAPCERPGLPLGLFPGTNLENPGSKLRTIKRAQTRSVPRMSNRRAGLGTFVCPETERPSNLRLRITKGSYLRFQSECFVRSSLHCFLPHLLFLTFLS